MTDIKVLDSLPRWFSTLCGVVHGWEMRHGSLEGFGETRQSVLEQLGIGSLSKNDLRDAPDFTLVFGPETVTVMVVDGTSLEMRRWSARAKAIKHHLVPRMLISRWASTDGRVVWRRADWEAGRLARMKPEKIMRESDAYGIKAHLDPELAEGLLAMLEGGTAEILQAIDDVLDRPADGRRIEWSGSLADAQPILKLFIAYQLIRTRNGRKRAESAVPFEEYVKAVAGPADVTKSEMRVLRQNYKDQLKFASSIIDPDSPFYKWASGSETEAYIGLPEPFDDVFPLTDDPVVAFPLTDGLVDEPSCSSWEAISLFLPISPRAGIGIKRTSEPRNTVKWASISIGMVELWCAELARGHTEVVLPSKKTWVWDVFNARTEG